MPQRLLRSLTCLLFLCAPFFSFAQTARFSGQVTDPSNAAVPNAEVQVINEESSVKFSTKTDGSGTYTVPYLPAGHYQVVVRVPGFSTSVNSGIALGMGQAFVFNVQLSVSGEQSTVTVEGGAASVSQVKTENAEVSGTITGKEVAELQLNGRNFSQLIALAPGVSNQTSQDEARVGMAGSVSYSVNGGRVEYNSFQVDGSEILNVGINKDHTSLIVTPSIDAIQEIKILTSNYGAMYPSSGNGTTLITTKSGTDKYHGSVYEFLRNEMFNAKGYFDVTNGAPLYRRQRFWRNIRRPAVDSASLRRQGENALLFLRGSAQGNGPLPYRQAVPSLAERNGDFSDLCPYVPPGGYTSVSSKYPDCPHYNGHTYFGNILPA
jgi:outer membrane receptor protein involved in Fe transport